jgi:zinc-binding alcohol dehydrogenase family protein
LDVELPDPVPGLRDLLVEVRAVGVNPLDTKLRARPNAAPGSRVLGWDASGVVVAVGAEVTLFEPGDAVMYAGSITRAGCNSARQVVDERLAGRKPATFSHAQAAALPAGAITAWEMLFERLRLARSGDAGALLVIGGAGGVGSMAIQLARALTRATVIATASREESREWCLGLGAHHVIDHTGDMAAQLKALGVARVPRIFCTTASDQHWKAMLSMVAPMGAIGLIDDGAPLDARALRPKGISLHYEAMFARAIFGLPDMVVQHHLLNEVGDLAADGRIRGIVTETLRPLSAATLRAAHAWLETGRAIGKVVVEV